MQAYDVCHVERRVFDPSRVHARSSMSVKTERDTTFFWLTNDVIGTRLHVRLHVNSENRSFG